ncbi:NAD(P)H-dependent oxidoreductase [Candidatus Endowatersipora endosymbiont of Watersipora subatra]|uniref:NADPH-dependent FMN reductase n=1 Tax=Candidatus Endowatersipora endosymbiont of Watersipora subatra TaxID=3077946 RepID=UPI00312C9AF3
MIPRVLIIPGSDRHGSYNVHLSGLIAEGIQTYGGQATILSLSDYELPLFSQNIEEKTGVPDGAKKLGSFMEKNEGIILVTPEYNGSLPPLLKNALDWLSRDLDNITPYQNCTFGLAACSPSNLGGIRVLSHLREILVSVGADVVTPQLTVGNASNAFNEKGQLLNNKTNVLLQKLLITVIERAKFCLQDKIKSSFRIS